MLVLEFVLFVNNRLSKFYDSKMNNAFNPLQKRQPFPCNEYISVI